MNLQHFLLRHTQHQDEFFATDQFPLDDEEIADTAINAMLLIMNNKVIPTGNTRGLIDDYAPMVASGIRFPWKDRVALGLCVDTLNDQLPDYAAIGLTRRTHRIFAQAVTISVCRHNLLKKNIKTALSCASSIFRTTYVRGFDGFSRNLCGHSSRDIETIVTGGYAGAMPNGDVIGVDDSGGIDLFHANILAYVVSIHNDRRYFWEVAATESFWDRYPAKAMFSIDEEYIKSLFYARTIPITATGRLRPILHWVSAHKRRLKEGVDIDVKKHLRGVDAFEMHGVNFSITEPRKLKSAHVSVETPHAQLL